MGWLRGTYFEARRAGLLAASTYPPQRGNAIRSGSDNAPVEGVGDRSGPPEPPGLLGRLFARQRKKVGSQGVRPRDAAFLIGSSWVVGVVVFGVIMHFVDPESFPTVWLGMWWALQTVTTVGYGDIVPAQADGKVIATFIMLGGLSLLAVVTGAVTSAFVSSTQRRRQEAGDDPVVRRLDDLSSRLERIESELGRRGGDTGNR